MYNVYIEYVFTHNKRGDTVKQIIIVRKDLNMSIGKLSVQVSHASMAFILNLIKQNTVQKLFKEYNILPSCSINYETGESSVQLYKRTDLMNYSKTAYEKGQKFFYTKLKDKNNPYGEIINIPKEELQYYYSTQFELDSDIYLNWVNDIQKKVVCEAKNKNQLMKAVTIAESLKLEQDKDFFIIQDRCLTELSPEEFDIEGNAVTTTCIGFKPLQDEIADKIIKKFQLYK